jgi:hypothetical protein
LGKMPECGHIQKAGNSLVQVARVSSLQVLGPAVREEGATSLRQIAAGLNAKGIATPRGGEWSAVQVQRALRAADWYRRNEQWRADCRAQSAGLL